MEAHSTDTKDLISDLNSLTKTKNKLPEHVQSFLKRIQKEFHVVFYYFGSIQRDDYLLGLSDIDIDVFPKNKSAKDFAIHLANYLHLPVLKIKKIQWQIPINNQIITGYKFKYTFHENLKIEFSVYPESSKLFVLYHHAQKLILPFWISWLLILLKILFYKYNLISSDFFFSTKRFLMSSAIGIPPDLFRITKFSSSNEFLHDS